ncbi:MAG: hypothetical protein ABIH89_03010 [Elusimicrobiota bacterium]
MDKLNKLGLNIEKLVSKYSDLKTENQQLKEKIGQIEKDLTFHAGRTQELPEVVVRNKKLLNERSKLTVKIDSILKIFDEVKGIG